MEENSIIPRTQTQ